MRKNYKDIFENKLIKNIGKSIMKSLNETIFDDDIFNTDDDIDLTKTLYKYYPETSNELKQLILKRMEDEGLNCDLNDIDVSKITDMSKLFNGRTMFFNGDISMWDVSHVTNMYSMFWNSVFTGDISKWDVSNVTNMHAMFYNSNFDGDISKWNIDADKCDVVNMFGNCPLKYMPLKQPNFIK